VYFGQDLLAKAMVSIPFLDNYIDFCLQFGQGGILSLVPRLKLPLLSSCLMQALNSARVLSASSLANIRSEIWLCSC
jgi:hypothetical protein